jgi:hypothetical protein
MAQVLAARPSNNPLAHLQLRESLSLLSARVTLAQPDVETVSWTGTPASPPAQVVRKPSPDLRARLATALETRVPTSRTPLKWEGNGGNGFKTWVSEQHLLDFNPCWLDFSMFDAMKLDVMEGPVGPGESEPQTWRSAVTVGMGAAWQIHPRLALQAGYRFYENPMPAERKSGALLNATQHVLATGLSYRQGAHSLSLIYGLDLLDAADGGSISSARYGDDLASTAHLVSFLYAFDF